MPGRVGDKGHGEFIPQGWELRGDRESPQGLRAPRAKKQQGPEERPMDLTPPGFSAPCFAFPWVFQETSEAVEHDSV